MGHADDHGLSGRVVVDVAHERDVQLHELRLQLQDVAQSGVSGARVVYCQSSSVANLVESGHQARIVLDFGMLGDLEDYLPIGLGQDIEQRDQCDRERRRDVQAEPGPLGKTARLPDLLAEGRGLELDHHANLVGRQKHEVGPPAVLEASEGLVPHGLSGGQVHDGLEDREEGVRGYGRLNLILQPFLLPALR